MNIKETKFATSENDNLIRNREKYLISLSVNDLRLAGINNDSPFNVMHDWYEFACQFSLSNH